MHRIQVTELMEIVFSYLFRQFREIDTAFVYTCRSSCLHAGTLETQRRQLLCQSLTGRFGNSPSSQLYGAEMQQAVQERAIGQYNALGIKFRTEQSAHTFNVFIFDYQ